MGLLTGDDDEQLFAAGDGLPVVEVTELKLREMLAYTNRNHSEVIGKCPPEYNECTVGHVAANAVLSGCKPEHFVVALAAVECILAEDYNLHGVSATTMGATPCIIVNGPIRESCGLNSGVGALGSGTRANACIGRCVKLVLKNVGKAVLGGTESTTLGTPMKYGFCVAEDEELLMELNNGGSSWKPLSTYRNTLTSPGKSSVTAVTVTSGPHQVVDFLERSADGVIDLFSKSLVTSYNWYAPFINECVLFVSPEHLRTLNAGGVRSKEELAKRLWVRCNSLMVWAYSSIIKTQIKNPILAFLIGNLLKLIGLAANLFGFGGLGGIIPKFNTPSSFHIVVTGGEAGKFSSFAPGFGVGKPGMPTFGLSKSVCKSVESPISLTQAQANFEKLANTSFEHLIDEIHGTNKSEEQYPLAKRNSEDLKGTIGLVDISKPMGNFFLDRIQKLLEKEFPLLEVKRYVKDTFSRPAKKTLIDKIIKECKYVVQGLVD